MLANASEHSFRTAEDLQKRITRIMQLGWHQGLRGIRTHVDSLGPHMQLTWEVLQDLRFNWKTRLSLQLVALLPLYYWGTQKGINLAKQIASSGGFLGGILGPPYIKSLKAESEVLTFLKLAQSFGCSVDLHVDEGNIALGHGVNLITRLMEKYNFDVSITCSHSSSMGLLPLSKLRNLAERMAYVNLQVVALPFTNFWLIGHHSEITPSQRPIAPIKQLQAAGVNVCVGSDNVQDAWFPAGNCDPIELIRFSTVTTHLTPWSRQGLVPFTTSPSRLMGLEWDGIFRIGAPASMILIDCSTWYRILAQPPRRRVLHNGKWILD
eukprot:gb/GEZN01007156.1/.p1 GENE.gb/GEZN01007156.1/~~gb/GEZN01007156.1/.p1  ORF type:complete len:323 (+),score=-19.52 gb/GEZN01007156.1/:344-1312(+)